MKNLIKLSALMMVAAACNSPKEQPEEANASSFDLFAPVNESYTNQTIILPEGFSYELIFSEQTDEVTKADGSKHPAKGKHDFTAYIPIEGSSEHGYLYVNHESNNIDDALGDGGGGTVFEVKKENGSWKVVGDFKHIDFAPVGGTIRNCGGTVTPHGTILTAEEDEPASNKSLYESYRDTTNFNGLKRHLNFGWMVEVDPKSGKVLRKLYSLGRYQHEDAFCTPDGKTLYMTDDACPAVLFKFEAETPHDYSKGQLYAFKETTPEQLGGWIKLPMEKDSLLWARDMAMKRGATLFVRHEWIEMVGDKLYVTETGKDEFDWAEPIAMGGVPASYFEGHKKEGNTYNDPYGRVLEVDPSTYKVRPYIEGGYSADKTTNFAGPDGLSQISMNGKNYLVISEDITSLDYGKVSDEAKEKGDTYNEIYWAEAGLENTSVEDLKRFAVGPRGCETTGSAFTPDGKTMFLSIQSPDKNNPEPFNRSCVIAITGFK